MQNPDDLLKAKISAKCEAIRNYMKRNKAKLAACVGMKVINDFLFSERLEA